MQPTFQFIFIIINSLIIFFLVSSSSPSPSPTSHLTRHRQTFFFDRVLASSSNDDNSFINDKIQIPEKNCALIKNFTGIREWKIYKPLENFFVNNNNNGDNDLSLFSDWKTEWSARVQIMMEEEEEEKEEELWKNKRNKEDGGENKGYESGSMFQHPFNVLPIPGVHVGFSIRSVEKVEEENDLADISKLCQLLDKLFGIFNCESYQQQQRQQLFFQGKRKPIDVSQSISLENGQYYFYSSNTPSLSLSSILINYLIQDNNNNNSNNDNNSNNNLNTLVLLDFNLKFDEKIQKPMMDLRFLWKYENQDIKIVKEEKEFIDINNKNNYKNDNNDDDGYKLEIGIFWDKLDDESFYGARLLFEQQHQKFKFIETLLTVPNDRVHPALNYSFNSVLSPNQTFHTDFHTTVKGDNDEIKGTEDEETCKLLFIHIIPNTFIVDKYQLDDSNDINDNNKKIEIFGEVNLESPVGDKSLRWGNVAIISQKMTRNGDVFRFPLHLRYQPPLPTTNTLSSSLTTSLLSIFSSSSSKNKLQSSPSSTIMITEDKEGGGTKKKKRSGVSIGDTRKYHQYDNNDDDNYSHVTVSVSWPLVVCLCDEKSNNNKNNNNNDNIDKPDPLFSQTPLPLSLFYNNKRKQIKYILPIQQNHWPIELVRVPIGQLNHLKIVELWTILVVLIGSFWIFWIVSKKIAAKNAQDKNKID